MNTVSTILIAIALFINYLSINMIHKSIDNMELWISYLLEKDEDYREYIKRKAKEKTEANE